MGYEIITAVEPEYIRVTVSGDYAVNDIFEFIERLKSEVKDANRRCVLIDTREFAAPMSDVDRFMAGRRMAEVFDSRFRTAVLLPPNLVTKMGELVAVNRGAQMVVTAFEEEAIEFLLKP